MTGEIGFNTQEIDAVLEHPELKSLVFEGAVRWMGVLITYLKESDAEVDKRLVSEVNELLDAIEDGETGVEIWSCYKRLIDRARLQGTDYLNMPLHFFGRTFH